MWVCDVIVEITKLDKKYKVVVPDDAPAELWQYGVVLGPPDLSALGLPYETEVRLHSELFVRGLIQMVDVQRHSGEVVSALQAALRVDAQRITELYMQIGDRPNG